MRNILILYGSKYRSTSKIVGKMRTYLEPKDIVVDTMTAMAEPLDIRKYSLVVIGSGIYGGLPHASVKEFIRINRDALIRQKIAVFAVCGAINSKRDELRNAARRYADTMSWGLSPKTKTVFAGKVPDLGLFRNWIKLRMALGVKPGDYREWDAIKRWTDSLAELA